MLERELGGLRRSVCRLNTRLGRVEVLLQPLERIADNLGRLAEAVERGVQLLQHHLLQHLLLLLLLRPPYLLPPPEQAHWPLLLLAPPMACGVVVPLGCAPEEEDEDKFSVGFIANMFPFVFNKALFSNFNFSFFKTVVFSHSITGKISMVLIT